MDIYVKKDYRQVLRIKFDLLKKVDKSITFAKMADFMRVQKPYVSKVLGGSADFNSDQLYKACEYLKFNDEEYEYTSLLLEYERSQFKDRKAKLHKHIKELRHQNTDAGKSLPSSTQMTTEEFDTSHFVDFYLDPLYSVLHVLLTIPKYKNNFELITKSLLINEERLEAMLQKLELMKIIKRTKKGIQVLIPSLHLPRDSKIIAPHLKLKSALCNHKKGDLPFSKKKAFSVTFSADDDAKNKIAVEFNNFLEKVQKIASEAKPVDCYEMSFDLFPWT
jgi:uncharacterized protein (TIGR02147 family)